MTWKRWHFLSVAFLAIAPVACSTATDQGRDYSVVMVKGVVRTSAGVPAPDVNVRADAFLVCGGVQYGEDVGLPLSRTDATGGYLLIVQSLLSPQRACVIVTATSAAGTTVQATFQDVQFRSVRGEVVDTVTANFVLP